MTSAQLATTAASRYEDSADGGSVDESTVDAHRFNEEGSFVGQYYQPNAAPAAVGNMAFPDDAVVGSAPKTIQLPVGGAARGGPRYYNPEELTAADADLDAAFDDDSAAASYQQQQQQLQLPPPRHMLPSPGYAGSLPILDDLTVSMQQQRQKQLDDQRRRLGGSAPLLLDDDWKMAPREFPTGLDAADYGAYSDVTVQPRRVPPTDGMVAMSSPAAAHHGNVDGWIDDEGEGNGTFAAGRPAPPPPPRPGFRYAPQTLPQAASAAAADDVFPVIYDADDLNYDRERWQQPRAQPFTGATSPRSTSMARSPSESSV